MTENAIYTGYVYHARHTPFFHDFRYPVFTLWAELGDLPALSHRLRLFSYNRWNALSLYDRDHGPRDGSDLREWIERAAGRKNIDLAGGKIYMLAFPRLFGYVFNPITLYFCYDGKGSLAAILYEVKNTFGEQHGYLLPVTAENPERIAQKTSKVFHVSPFIEMDCTYHFRLCEPGETLDFAIHQFLNTSGEKILTATWNGRHHPFTDRTITQCLVRMPLMTLRVIAGIHWQAFKIWLKGARYIPRPAPPNRDVS